MKDKIVLICGRSGSGKTTICNALERKYGFKQVESYTTRPKRHDNEQGHTFISEAEFDKLTDLVAFAKINGYRYAATSEQIDHSDLYVIDPSGIEEFKSRYKGNKQIVIVVIGTRIGVAYERMVDRLTNSGCDFKTAIETANKRMVDDIITFKNLKDMPYDFYFENDCGTNINDLASKIAEVVLSA